MARRTGDVILDVQNISLSFGGVKALTAASDEAVAQLVAWVNQPR